MDHRDATLELGLHLGIAGGGETQLSELLVLLTEGTAAQRCSNPSDKYQTLGLHRHLRMRAHRSRPPQWLIKNTVSTAVKGRNSAPFSGSSRDITPTIHTRGRGAFLCNCKFDCRAKNKCCRKTSQEPPTKCADRREMPVSARLPRARPKPPIEASAPAQVLRSLPTVRPGPAQSAEEVDVTLAPMSPMTSMPDAADGSVPPRCGGGNINIHRRAMRGIGVIGLETDDRPKTGDVRVSVLFDFYARCTRRGRRVSGAEANRNLASDLLKDLTGIAATISSRPGDRLILRAGPTAIPATLVGRVRRAKRELMAALVPCSSGHSYQGH